MRDYSKRVAATVLAAAVCIAGCSRGTSNPKQEGQADEASALTELAAVLQEELPAGWRVSRNRFNDEVSRRKGDIDLEIYRLEKVSFLHRLLPNPPIRAEGEYDPVEPYTFYLNLHKTEYLTPAEYRAIKDHNDKIDERRQQFTESLMDVPRHGKDRAYRDISPLGYFPENEEQRERVAEFRAYCEANKKTFLPQDFHYNKMAFAFYDPRHSLEIDNESFNAECDAVINTLKKVLNEY